MTEEDLSPVDSGGGLPHSAAVMSISDFIERCDRYCETRGVTRVWLSKRLFKDTYRLEDLAADKSDVGVKRLERASEELAALEAEPSHGEAAA